LSAGPEELARQALSLLGDDEVEPFVALCDPEVELRPLIAGVEGDHYRGHDGVRRWFEELSSSFDERRAPILSIDALGTDALVAEIALHLRGRGSGIEIDQHVFGGARYRDGLVVWWGFFETREEALAALEASGA
jgi:hypothetical protein